MNVKKVENQIILSLSIIGLALSVISIIYLLNISSKNEYTDCLFISLASFLFNLISSVNGRYKIILITVGLNLTFSFIMTMSSSFSNEIKDTFRDYHFWFTGLTLAGVAINYIQERAQGVKNIANEEALNVNAES
ncbi:hypothetical protein [Limnobaculum xujianqingii]|uniref:hypothetical protein n=1 Tax=Limnobaculum xujianqingii TaxID=2738837 RepID=UPI00112DC5B6|nr:hypothetical protein [Limnobaculum xujianqingii]